MASFLDLRGGYRSLRVYRVTEVIYDITFYFTRHFLKVGDRTVDQMVQAARSGKQNIAEGSSASGTSIETEIKLTNVARASLQELLVDYEDYLRFRGLKLWGKTRPRFEGLRRYVKSDNFFNEYSEMIRKLSGEEICNLAITLIHQSDYMLRRLLERQQERFVKDGGVRERMTKVRLEYRKKISD